MTKPHLEIHATLAVAAGHFREAAEFLPHVRYVGCLLSPASFFGMRFTGLTEGQAPDSLEGCFHLPATSTA
jgi:hypothetical protein